MGKYVAQNSECSTNSLSGSGKRLKSPTGDDGAPKRAFCGLNSPNPSKAGVELEGLAVVRFGGSWWVQKSPREVGNSLALFLEPLRRFSCLAKRKTTKFGVFTLVKTVETTVFGPKTRWSVPKPPSFPPEEPAGHNSSLPSRKNYPAAPKPGFSTFRMFFFKFFTHKTPPPLLPHTQTFCFLLFFCSTNSWS